MSKTLEFVQQINDDLGSTYHKMIDGEGSIEVTEAEKWLSNNGWRPYNALSKCSKASNEVHLKKGNAKIEIISANFMGKFVEVNVINT